MLDLYSDLPLGELSTSALFGSITAAMARHRLKLPADLNWQTTGIIVLMALILSVLATLYPSWRASRLDPVEALRYE